jgi:hypothetical protein
MSNQLQITGGAKVRNLDGAIVGTSGVLSSVPLGGANGVATLDSGGKVPVSQLPSSVVTYLGTWNAATNTPTLTNGTGDAGDMYLCNVAGTVNFGAGPISFNVGDWVLYGSGTWQKSNGQNGTVTSVAVTESSAALNITGSPITTSGTINIGFAGTSAQYVAGDGSLITFPSTINNATNLLALVRNNTGATIPAGSLVYITGGLGNHAVVSLAEANSEATSSQTFGMMQNDLADNTDGYVVISGQVTDLDTSAYADGTVLYLSPTVPGGWTGTKPVAPNHMVYVGTVIYSHAIHGTIQTRIQNGYELQELHNVLITSPANGNILQYDASISLWKNVAGTTTNIAEGTNLYYTDARVRAALSATTPLSFNSSTGAFSISQANTSTNGYLSSTDWNTFNNKQNALGYVPIGGSGSINYVAKFTGPTTISNSIIYDDGTTAQIGGSLTVQGNLVVSPSSGFPQATILGAATTELRIQTSSASYTSDIRFTSGPTAAYGLLRYDNTNNYLTFYTNSIAYSRLFNNGNFVIGSTLTDNGFKLEVQGTAKISSQLTLGSTITNGTYTYTLPSATGTLALTSQIPSLSGYVTGTASSGQVPYFTGTSSVAGSNNLFWDTSNLRLGIGLNNPQRSLEIYSATADSHLRLSGSAPSVSMGEAITGSVYQAKFGLATASGQYVSGAVAGDFVIISQTGSTIWANSGGERMRLNTNGTFSIGNTNSTYNLDVTGTGRFTGAVLISTNLGLTINPSSGTSYQAYQIGGTNYLYTGVAGNTDGIITGAATGDAVFRSVSGKLLFSANNGASANLAIATSGNVGIGTTSPSTNLSINSSGSNTNQIDFSTSSGSLKGHIGLFANNFYITSNWYYNGSQNADNTGYAQNAISFDSTGFLSFLTSAAGASVPAERMRITSGGNVCINSTGAIQGAGTAQLNVRQLTGTLPAIIAAVEDASATQDGTILLGCKRTASSAYSLISAYSGNGSTDDFNVQQFKVTGNGVIYAMNAVIQILSDERLKENVKNSTDGLNIINALRPVRFDYKNGFGNDKKNELGFIAQEVEKVFPEALSEWEQYGEIYKTLGSSSLIPVLVKAIQELSAEVNELKSLINK